MERSRDRERRSEAEDTGGAADEIPPSAGVHTDKDVAQILALATRLQLRDQAAQQEEKLLSSTQLAAIARELGIDPRYVSKAVELVRSGGRSMVMEGDLATVKRCLVEHFSKMQLTPGGSRSLAPVAPSVSLRGDSSLQVDWERNGPFGVGGSLTVSLRAVGEGQTEVSWDSRLTYNESKAGDIALGAMTVGAGILFLALGAPGVALVSVLSLSGSLAAARAGGKYYLASQTEELSTFCRRQLENVQLIVATQRPA